MSTFAKATIATIVAAVAAALVALFMLGGGSGKAAAAPTSTVWHVGTTWKLKVRKNAGLIAPDAKRVGYQDVWTLRVIKAPATAAGEWVVSAKLAGSEGMFAQGFRLYYERTSTTPDVFVLHQLGLGTTPAQPIALAEPLLGAGFPLQPRIAGSPATSAVRSTGVPTTPPTLSLGRGTDTGGAAGALGKALSKLPPRALVLPPGVRDVGPRALINAEHASQRKH